METKKQWILPEVTELEINAGGDVGGDASSLADFTS
jgi:hypothetical protein